MMEQLDVEIEPMDSMFGIDAQELPEPADAFRRRSIELRLAWAAAADWNAPLNLLRGSPASGDVGHVRQCGSRSWGGRRSGPRLGVAGGRAVGNDCLEQARNPDGLGRA